MTLAQAFETLLPCGEMRRFGELTLSHSSEGVFSACHKRDTGMTGHIPTVDSVSDLREIAKFDASGEFRPLKTAPSLKSGWKIECRSSTEFLELLDVIYPAVVGTWLAYQGGDLTPVPLRDTLDRQTGQYSQSGQITDQMANQIMRSTCSQGCIRKIAWPIDNCCKVSRLTRPPRDIPVICTEACTFAIEEARRLVKEADEKEDARS
tara:strand:- start:5471 stop:6091 length:621 start_codon:yes stop_codon:yes gene_type:complete